MSNLHVKLTSRFVFSIPTFLDFSFWKETFITVTWLLSIYEVEHNNCKILSDDLSVLDWYKKGDSDSFGAFSIISSTELPLVIIVTVSIKITWNKKNDYIWRCTFLHLHWLIVVFSAALFESLKSYHPFIIKYIEFNVETCL